MFTCTSPAAKVSLLSFIIIVCMSQCPRVYCVCWVGSREGEQFDALATDPSLAIESTSLRYCHYQCSYEFLAQL